ncbi:MAG: hypothetical protein IJ081_01415 [Prevotella sp.]|jgi:hypothetical protein|nr:hypothetical protein [Prevotella sp.]
MIKIKHLVLAAALFVGIVPLKIEAKHVVVPKMYMFGFAASFNDTIVHFTNVIEVDSVWMESKNKFLLGRNYYSYQLRSYLSTKENLPERTCVIQFAKTRKKAEKKLLKMKRLYTNSKDGKLHYDVRYLDEFKFKTINIKEYEQSEEERAEQPNKKKKNKRSK